MTLTKKRWFVLAASCFVNLCIGSLYAWSVFATPEAEYLKSLTGKAVSNIALVFTVANSVGPITMIGGGFVNDRLGPKWVVLIGGLMFGLGMILSGYAKSFGILMFSYGILVGLGVGMVYGCTVSNAVKFSPIGEDLPVDWPPPPMVSARSSCLRWPMRLSRDSAFPPPSGSSALPCCWSSASRPFSSKPVPRASARRAGPRLPHRAAGPERIRIGAVCCRTRSFMS